MNKTNDLVDYLCQDQNRIESAIEFLACIKPLQDRLIEIFLRQLNLIFSNTNYEFDQSDFSRKKYSRFNIYLNKDSSQPLLNIRFQFDDSNFGKLKFYIVPSDGISVPKEIWLKIQNSFTRGSHFKNLLLGTNNLCITIDKFYNWSSNTNVWIMINNGKLAEFVRDYVDIFHLEIQNSQLNEYF